MNPLLMTTSIAVLTTAGVLLRPFRMPEAVWALAGAAALVLLGVLSPAQALAAAGKGSDVYLFLAGMMLLSESARRAGLFDWLAVAAVNHARGSTLRLFALIYAVGVVVTVFLSNDATAVVLTPAVYAATRRAQASPLPFLFACAFIANAASFVLPISNPANLVLYGGHMPALGTWLAAFTLPSIFAIGATWAVLRWTQRAALAGACARDLPQASLSPAGRAALLGIVATALALVTVSALDRPLGLPTAVLGFATTAYVLWRGRVPLVPVLREVSWGVLPMVAGLFVVVDALDAAGLVQALAGWLQHAAAESPARGAALAGTLLALVCNLVNNLPAGLVASSAVAQAQPPRLVVDALLIGVDLGPNLSVSGSLATLLWLAALRREGEHVGFWRFLALGALVMPPALVLALAARLALG